MFPLGFPVVLLFMVILSLRFTLAAFASKKPITLKTLTAAIPASNTYENLKLKSIIRDVKIGYKKGFCIIKFDPRSQVFE
jgi:hypothetical protein